MHENNKLKAQGLRECIVKQFQELTTFEKNYSLARKELGWVH